MLIYLCFRFAAVVHAYLAYYSPTTRLIAWLSTPPGLKWAIPVALVAVPAYMFTASLCRVIIDDGGPEYLYLLVMLCGWNVIKFLALAVRSPFRFVGLLLSRLFQRAS